MGLYIIDSLENIIDYQGLNNFNKKQNDSMASSVLVNVRSYIHKRVLENKIYNLTTICDEVQLFFFRYQIEQKNRYRRDWNGVRISHKLAKDRILICEDVIKYINVYMLDSTKTNFL